MAGDSSRRGFDSAAPCRAAASPRRVRVVRVRPPRRRVSSREPPPSSTVRRLLGERAVSPPGLIASSVFRRPRRRMVLIPSWRPRPRPPAWAEPEFCQASGRARPSLAMAWRRRTAATCARANARDRRDNARPVEAIREALRGSDAPSAVTRPAPGLSSRNTCQCFRFEPRRARITRMVRTAACDRTVRQHTRRDVLGDAVERSARERRAEMDAELGTHALAEEPPRS